MMIIIIIIIPIPSQRIALQWNCLGVLVCSGFTDTLLYASDSGAARICQWEAKARERSDRAGGGGGGGRGLPPTTVGRFLKFAYENDIFLYIKCHY